jgi:hypothetical protein
VIDPTTRCKSTVIAWGDSDEAARECVHRLRPELELPTGMAMSYCFCVLIRTCIEAYSEEDARECLTSSRCSGTRDCVRDEACCEPDAMCE